MHPKPFALSPIRKVCLQSWAVGAIAILSLACRPGQEAQATKVAPDSLLIRGVFMVDPATSSVSKPSDLLVLDGHIAEVTETGMIDPATVARVFEGHGLFALPGLIDVHAHIGDGGLGEQTYQDRETALQQFVRYGVTTIFAPGGGGGNEDDLAMWKKKAKSSNFPGIYGSGAIITAPGSHPIGTIWNFPEDADPALVYKRGAVAVAEDEDVRPLLEHKKQMGVDAIKIIIEDGPGPWVPKPRLSKAKVAELVEVSHELGLRVFAHISLAAHLNDGVEAGVDGVMHSAEDPIDEAMLEEMARKHTFYVATLALYDGFFKQALGQFETDPYAEKGVSKRALESLQNEASRKQAQDPPDWVEPTRKALQSNLRRALAAGVPLALGTDVNNPTVFPGYSAHQELALMVEAGLTPAQALQAATTGSAAFLQKETTLGKLQPGYEADLLLLTKNPLENILNTRTIMAVVADGNLIGDVVSVD